MQVVRELDSAASAVGWLQYKLPKQCKRWPRVRGLPTRVLLASAQTAITRYMYELRIPWIRCEQEFVFQAVQSCRLRRIPPSVYLFLEHCDTPYRQRFWSRLAELCGRSAKHRDLTYVRIYMASMPLGTAARVAITPCQARGSDCHGNRSLAWSSKYGIIRDKGSGGPDALVFDPVMKTWSVSVQGSQWCSKSV